MTKILLQKRGKAREFNTTVLEWLRDVKCWEVTEPKHLAGKESTIQWNYVNPKAKLYLWPKEWEVYCTKAGSLHIVEEHYSSGKDYDEFLKAFCTEPDFIEAFETLGDLAGNNFKIVEIPDNVDWYLEEDYGVYYIVEKHRSWG